MKVAVVFVAALALASALPQHGWRKAAKRDLSKYKPVYPTVTPNTTYKSKLRALLKTPSAPAKSFPANADCGIMGGNGIDTHIVGGTQAAPHQFPWQVGIFMDDSYFCGGSIISEEYILTAAHCVFGFSKFDVVIGAHEIRNPTEEGHIETTAVDYEYHPNYNQNNLRNDIAILKVSAITFNDFASPICLPTAGEVGDTLEGETITVSGWGRESDASGGIATFLNFVTAPVISNAECDAVYGIVVDGMICIDTTGGRGTCNGDSGGPMVRDRSSTKVYTQYGVVSYGASAGCELGYPAGFTRVTEYLEYISGVTGMVF